MNYKKDITKKKYLSTNYDYYREKKDKNQKTLDEVKNDN